MKAISLKIALLLCLALVSYNPAYTQVQVISPNGGETWVSGDSTLIQWRNLGQPGDFTIFYTYDNGINWFKQFNIKSITGLNEFKFVPDFSPNDQAKIRISSNSNPALTDESDNVFSVRLIDNYIYGPYTGQVFYSGSQVNVQWFSNSKPVNIDLSSDRGITWTQVGTNVNGESFKFTAPAINSTQCRIKLTDVTNQYVVSKSQVFSILSAPVLTVLSPNGGEEWIFKGNNAISWSGSGISSYVVIDFSPDGGTTWQNIGYGNSSSTGGSITVPTPIVSTVNALIRISDPDTPTSFDVSNAPFKITIPSFPVYAPKAGMTYYTNQPIGVMWDSFDSAQVNVQISIDNGVSFTTVGSNLPKDQNYYTFNAPSTPSQYCIIKIVSNIDPSVFSLSPVFFIVNTPVLTLLSPAGGELWDNDSTYSITYSYTGAIPQNTYLSFDFSSDNGQNWTNIGWISYAENFNTYSWKTPGQISGSCLIRVSDYYYPFIADTSKSVFSILEIPSIDICMVSVDSVSGKNTIVWNKVQNNLISEYVILKEGNVSNVYQEVGEVPSTGISTFIDINSNPLEKATRYKIAFKDSNGILYGAGSFHQTIHLSINQGVGNTWNLNWSPYLGFPVSSYNIYRGNNSRNMQLIGTVSGNFTSYTDLNAQPGFVYYMVEVINPNNCNPEGLKSGIYSSSVSNIVTNSILSSKNDLVSASFDVYPNPATDRMQIKPAHKMEGKILLSVISATGQVVQVLSLDADEINNGYVLMLDKLYPGIYTLQVKSKEAIGSVRFIKTR
ncbi:MAG: T9SS type A sorting domain-containing protein [Bacteroidales bacterium]|nr:T9SS type A sorting domain-containing protein [Bacteroidales bacterium]